MISLGVLTVLSTEIAGLPKSFFASFAGAASLLAINSFRCWRIQPGPSETQLLTIGLLNIAYCVVSLSAGAFMHRSSTPLSMAYFAIELAIVIPFAIYEIYIAKAAEHT